MEGTSTNANNGLGVLQDLSVSSEQDFSVSTAPEFSTRSADDARSSISSDKSDAKPPRSAMRRSSSISKIPQSPRRVRFDFMGEEVLPTTSPQPSAFMSGRIPSPDPIGDETNCASHMATEPGEEEEEEYEAPPRKVSSSDALRALSRAPLEEDGTLWTVVNSDQDEPAPHQPHDMHVNQVVEAEEASTTSSAAATTTTTNNSESTSTVTTAESIHKTNTIRDANSASQNSEEESSDDDFLAMAKPKAPASSASRAQALLSPTKAIQQPASPQSDRQPITSPKIKTSEAGYHGSERNRGTSAAMQDESELFHFEEEGGQFPERPTPSQDPVEEKQSEDEHSDHDESSGTPTSQPLNLYATSPAVPIARQVEREADPPTPSRAKFEPNTVGSYKGRPLTMPVMRNPELLAELESSQPVNEVVGSVHHRGPTDQFNPVSFQEKTEQAVAFGAPRSFSERLMIEDMMEAAKARSQESGGTPTVRGQ